MYSLSSIGLNPESVKVLVVSCSLIAVVLMAFSVLLYALRTIGIYNMSRTARFYNSWYAFIPFFSSFAFGRLAGINKKRDKTKYAKSLTVLQIISATSFVVSFVWGLAVSVDILFAADDALLNNTQIAAENVKNIIFPAALMLISVFTKTIYHIIKLVCAWKIYCIFSKNNAVVLIFFSIIIPLLIPAFIFSISKHSIYIGDDRKKEYIL
ncbi:MAG: hypothetical protein MJ090_05710 [Clostridia bacterium]|nr:hypothetical protein [Clostridia bacterium]